MKHSKIVNVLKFISKKLKKRKIKWVLVGSASLALQGVKIKPKDIDILTDKEGAFKFNQIFKKFEIKPVQFGKTKVFQSFLGRFKIKGVKVEVMGDLKEKRGRKWVSLSNRLKNSSWIKIGEIKIPISQLKDELESYSKLKRKKDKIKIKKILEQFEFFKEKFKG